MLKRTARVIRRVDLDALDLAGEFLFEGFEREEIIAANEAIIEHVAIGHAVRRVIGLLRIFKQDARLQPRPVLLANPGEFQFLSISHGINAELFAIFLG